MLYAKHISMKKYLCLFMTLLFGNWGCSCNFTEPEFKTIRVLQRSVKDYAEIGFSINVIGLLSGHEKDKGFFRGQISYLLEQYGCHTTFAEAYDGLRVEFTYKYGYGRPRIYMHYDPVFTFIDYSDLKLIETKTGLIIGEVEYNRQFCGENPPDLVEKMLLILLKKDKTNR